MNMTFNSIIPHDRILLNGKSVKAIARVRWTISDVFDYSRRTSSIDSVDYEGINLLGMQFIRSGHGIVPINLEIYTEDNKIIVIY